MKLRAITLAVGLALSAGAGATTLSGKATADNEFWAYLSTSDSVLGSLIGTGNNWGATYSFTSGALVNGTDYYLHVVARDYGRPEAFLGQFTLSDAAFSFTNGTQSLLTGVTADWKASAAASPAWAAPTGTPVDRGVNGVGPWGFHGPISASAHWIWSADYGTGTTYFSTKIVSNVPEPETYAMMLAGLGLLGAAARRKRAA
ncbi:MAG: PEPxxWA-CTERM sorting domain-containing protein [Rhodocyclaceae bacterium]|nr:PEPxxWA-CTERM sorting domain-containing protein [Rhodocyclaceae bacterium]